MAGQMEFPNFPVKLNQLPASLHFHDVQAGDSIDLRAAEPMKVLLGFAAGVQVEYNGQSYDPSPHTARGLARFSLGG